ncbi:MAG: ROK family protein [bacterium]|nr:ROK family protein [bacterium]
MFILFDIGGTKLRIAASRDGVTFSEPRILETPREFNQALFVIGKAVHELAGGVPVNAIIGGVAGSLDKSKSVIVRAPNLPAWHNAPLKHELERRLGAPVMLENDAALEALGEAVHGAGKHHDIVGYLTVGTGIGGARIVRGRIDAKTLGFEPGHQIVDPKGPPCACGGRGHLESFVSGAALYAHTGRRPEDIEDPHVWDALAQWLAVGTYNALVHWSPDIIIFGGSMMKKIPLERVHAYAKGAMHIFGDVPHFVHGTLGDSAGLYGALALLKQR